MSKHPTTPTACAPSLPICRKRTHSTPTRNCSQPAPADEQAALLNQVLRLLGFGYRNLGVLMAWETTFAIARLMAKLERQS